MKKKYLVLTSLVALSGLITACGGSSPKSSSAPSGSSEMYSFPDFEKESQGEPVSYSLPNEGDEAIKKLQITDELTRFNNIDYSEYNNHGSSLLDGQWDDYGVGDPYVFKHNGVYYLYSSAKNGSVGIKAWKSFDLVNWRLCSGSGYSQGFVTKDRRTYNAVSPEVYYLNGEFYMYFQTGTGNLVFKSDSPEGEFKYMCSLGDDDGYDGTVYHDGEGRLYFFKGSSNGITVQDMISPTELNKSSKQTIPSTIVSNLYTGSLETSSPDVFEIGNYLYLTYSKTNIDRASYRTCYVSAMNANTSSVDGLVNSFYNQIHGPLMVSTDKQDDVVGLGGLCVVEAPDMQSYYGIYTNLNEKGPNRSLNIDPIHHSGNMLSMTHRTSNSIAPDSYDTLITNFEPDDRGLVLTGDRVGSYFSGEYNFKDVEKVYIEYSSLDSFVGVIFDYDLKEVKLQQCINGIVVNLGSRKINNLNKNIYHVVKCKYDQDLLSVSFDGYNLAVDYKVTFEKGFAGYLTNENSEIGFTAFSSMPNCMVEGQAVKYAESVIPGSSFLQYNNGEIQGIYKLSEGSGNFIEMRKTEEFYGVNILKLAKSNDYVRYLADVNEDGRYGVEIALNASFTKYGCSLGIRVGDNNEIIYKTSQVGSISYARILTAEFDVSKGINEILIENLSNAELDIVYIRLVKVCADKPDYQNDLSSYADKGMYYVSDFVVREDSNGDLAHKSHEGIRSMAYIGDGTISDFKLSISIEMTTNYSSAGTCGIAFRCRNFYSSTDADNADSLQGYYLAISQFKVTLKKCNYNDGETLDSKSLTSTINTYYNYIVIMQGNNIKVYRNDELIFDVVDQFAFSTGYLGLCSNNCQAFYKNLAIVG